MPSLSVLIHADADAQRLARLLETLRSADDVVVIDHGQDEKVRKVTREYGARLVRGVPGVDPGAYAVQCRSDWVLCLQPAESLSEALEASLFEWKRSEHDPLKAFSVSLREHNGSPPPSTSETRLVNRRHVNWKGKLPPHITAAEPLAGDLLRFMDSE